MKGINLIIVPLISFFFAFQGLAQDSIFQKNAIHFEFGGNGLLYSINYEHKLDKSFHAKVGGSFFQIIENQTNKSLGIYSFPLSFHHQINLKSSIHFLESGIGLMNLMTSGNLVEFKGVKNYYLNPFINLGYRKESEKQRWIYRFGLSPFWGTKSLTNPTLQGFYPFGNKIQVWGYWGLGYNFK